MCNCAGYITFRPLILRIFTQYAISVRFRWAGPYQKGFISCFLMSLFTLFQIFNIKTRKPILYILCLPVIQSTSFEDIIFFNKLTFVPNSTSSRANLQSSCSNKIFTNVHHRYSVLAVY